MRLIERIVEILIWLAILTWITIMVICSTIMAIWLFKQLW